MGPAGPALELAVELPGMAAAATGPVPAGNGEAIDTSSIPPALLDDADPGPRLTPAAAPRPGVGVVGAGPLPRLSAADDPERLAEFEDDAEAQRRARSPEAIRQRTAENLADYGPVPEKLWQAMAYYVRVMLRKRELSVELMELSGRRKAAAGRTADAYAQLGQSLYAHRQDPSLQALSRNFRAIAQSEDKIGDVVHRGQHKKGQLQHELSKLEVEVQALDRVLEPKRKQEATLMAQLEDLQAQARGPEATLRKIAAEVEQIRAGKKTMDPQRRDQLVVERDGARAALKSLKAKMAPLQQQLMPLTEELDRRTAELEKLEAERDTMQGTLGRATEHQRVSAGTAKASHRDALVLLAKAALEAGLGRAFPELAHAAQSAEAHEQERRREEEIHRLAVECYDEPMFQRGFQMLMGGSIAIFLFFTLLVIF